MWPPSPAREPCVSAAPLWEENLDVEMPRRSHHEAVPRHFHERLKASRMNAFALIFLQELPV